MIRNRHALLLVLALGGASTLACSSDAEYRSEEAASAPAADGVGYTGSGESFGVADRAAQAPARPPAPAPGTPELPTDTAGGEPSGSTAASLMIIRTGHASVQVESLEPAIARVRRLAEGLGGFVANTAVHAGREDRREATLELKIPAASFDRAVEGLRPIGRVERVNVTAQDVGEEYADVSARMSNARRLEARLIELLANRTGNLEQVLAVERELARVREEIERYEGRLRYLRARVALSTLTVSLYEDGVPSRIGDAFGEAWDNFVNFVAGFIASLGVLVPLLVLLIAVWWLFSALRRWMRGHPERFGGPARRPTPPAPEDREA